ncbi:hypothetical protein AB0M02_06700 [Actinoplanes sp. NPDC051861]|uniref:hypothetical protein n=1 Tax=Actinoplanes sp. NPDC051861 TaxID=3155170 RepID=UPI003422574A
MRRRALILLTLLLGACTTAPAGPAWIRLGLPGAPNADLRAIADCDGRFYLVGGHVDDEGDTRPAGWTSADAISWEPVGFDPLPTSQYGPQNVISAVACAAGRVVMLGSARGGAHGNPRVSTWHRLPNGRMAENAAPFETYGGDTAVDVAHLAAGPRGFAIAGNRSSGAAAWLSPDGTGFTLFENAPGLASTAAAPTAARDAVALPDGRWLVIGSRGNRAAAWTSHDGRRWHLSTPPGPDAPPPGSTAPPAGSEWSEMQRAVVIDGTVVAAGPRGTSFATWRLRDDTWTEEPSFGGAPSGVQSLAAVSGQLVLAGGGLWIAADGRTWRQRTTPETPVAATGRDDILLVVTAGAAYRSVF